MSWEYSQSTGVPDPAVKQSAPMKRLLPARYFMEIWFMAMCFMVLPVRAADLTPQQLTQQITAQGPEAVIATLYAHNEHQWRRVMEEIGKGESDWLNVASRLAPGSDADSAESLATAVATAIPHNPAGVLAILDDNAPPLNTRDVCGLPFYTLSEPQLDHYIVAAIRALYKVAGSKACIDTLVNVIGQSDGFNGDN